MSSTEPEYFYCLKHHAVEGRKGCRAADRLGPYPTEAEAARALEKVAERNEAWAAQDADLDGGDGGDGADAADGTA